MKVHKLNELPDCFTQLHTVPKKLYYAGNKELLFDSAPKIAVVGSRNMSHYGRQIITDIVRQLAEWGIIIVSGLALGVDGLAHKTTLAHNGKTIAVLPSGISHIYPRTHHHLARSITDSGGLLLSEYETAETIYKNQFIERNRLVAALADAVFIPEAALASGSLHTARFALELGKPVLAVPGNIYSPTSQGTNNLIKSGAYAITSAQDIIHAIGYVAPEQESLLVAQNEQQLAILKLIKSGTSHENELARVLSIDSSTLLESLTMLELDGKISTASPGHWI